MSLIINSNIETRSGIQLASAYARLSVTDRAVGNIVTISLDYYPTDQAFLNGLSPLGINSQLTSFQMPYDRAADGNDILMLGHEYAKTQLADAGITSIIAELG